MVATTTVGAIAAGVAIVLWYFKRRGRALTICCLLAGFAIALPLSQWLAGPLSALDQIAGWVAVNLLLAASASTWLFFELKEKGTRSFTPWVALLAPCLFVLAAGPFLLAIDVFGGVAGSADAALSSVGR